MAVLFSRFLPYVLLTPRGKNNLIPKIIPKSPVDCSLSALK